MKEYLIRQFTPGGVTPTDDLALYKVSPGKAYIKGYEIESVNAVYLDVDKPRTTRTLEDQSIIYNTGPTLRINRVHRTPTIGVGNTYFVSLRDQRLGVVQKLFLEMKLVSQGYMISDWSLDHIVPPMPTRTNGILLSMMYKQQLTLLESGTLYLFLHLSKEIIVVPQDF